MPPSRSFTVSNDELVYDRETIIINLGKFIQTLRQSNSLLMLIITQHSSTSSNVINLFAFEKIEENICIM